MLNLLQAIVPFELNLHVVRKLAHFVEFAVLGFLGQLAAAGRVKKWWQRMLLAVLLGVMIALCDETIQLFVSGRTGKLADVWLDLSGALTGALLVNLVLWLVERRKKHAAGQ